MGLVRKQAQPGADETVSAPASLDVLLLQLDDLSSDCRREAALALEGRSEAIPALVERLGAESEWAVRDAMLTTLAAHDTAPVAEGLIAYLGAEDASLRTGVAEALATMPRSVPALLPELLANPDHDVRVMTAMVLADLPDPGAVTWLIRMISDDPHPNVVATAIEALLPAASAQHIALLDGVLARFPDDPFLRFTVEKALPRLEEAR